MSVFLSFSIFVPLHNELCQQNDQQFVQNLLVQPKLRQYSYKILNPKAVDGLDVEKEGRKIAQLIIEAVGLNADQYRLGMTKA